MEFPVLTKIYRNLQVCPKVHFTEFFDYFHIITFPQAPLSPFFQSLHQHRLPLTSPVRPLITSSASQRWGLVGESGLRIFDLSSQNPNALQSEKDR